jgi:hypothetical protein
MFQEACAPKPTTCLTDVRRVAMGSHTRPGNNVDLITPSDPAQKVRSSAPTSAITIRFRLKPDVSLLLQQN